MRKMNSIIGANINNNFQSKALIVVFLGTVIICTAAVILIGGMLIIGPAVKSGNADADTLAYHMGLIGYFTAFLMTGVTYCVLFSVPMTREKTRGNIESLLATATSVKKLWLAKSVALFIPALAVGIVVPLVLTVIINYIYFYPQFGFLLNPWLAVSTYIAVPIVYFCLSLLIHLVGLLGRTADGNVLAAIFLPAAINLMINLAVHKAVDASSWPFVLANLGLAAILFILTMIFLPKLKKERIILSCRK